MYVYLNFFFNANNNDFYSEWGLSCTFKSCSESSYEAEKAEVSLV